MTEVKQYGGTGTEKSNVLERNRAIGLLVRLAKKDTDIEDGTGTAPTEFHYVLSI